MKDMLNVRNRETSKVYQAYVQSVDLNFNGRYVLRYVVGIQGHNDFAFIECIYSNDDFNERYEVIKWDRGKKVWVPVFER